MKHLTLFTIMSSQPLTEKYQLLWLTSDEDLDWEAARPGQFVQIKIEHSPDTFLRRPISICNIDAESHRLCLLVARAGKGTDTLCDMKPGEKLDVIWPLGNSFSIPAAGKRVLLMGGGVGVAPVFFLASKLREAGVNVEVLLAARTSHDLLLKSSFESICPTHVATDDGSEGHHGLITTHPAFTNGKWDMIATCGPRPMMRAIALSCDQRNIDCEVSLENVMACGIGACLCCVEKTHEGNKCVCTTGPVFKSTELTW